MAKTRTGAARKNLLIETFESAPQWERWLAKNHALSNGVWLRIKKKKQAPNPSLTLKPLTWPFVTDGSTDKNKATTANLGCKNSRVEARRVDGRSETSSTSKDSQKRAR